MMSTPIINACHWMCRLCWIHIGFVLFTILGLGVFGFCPATVMSCLMIRRYLNGRSSISLKMMWTEYKKEFFRANKAGLLLVFIAAVFFFYYSYGSNAQGAMLNIAGTACLVFSVITVVFLYGTLVMMSMFDAVNVKGILSNGAVFLRDYVVVVATVAAYIAMALIGKMIPLVMIFYGLAPVFFTTVGLMWLRSDELKNVN